MNKVKLLRISFILAISLFFVKLGAYLCTYSQMILSDALESIINVVASGFALYSVQWASRPKDYNHPYGHGKIEFFAAGLEGSLIMLAGAGIIISSVYKLCVGQSEVQYIVTGTILTLFSALINAGIGYVLIQQGTKHQSLVLTAEGKHLLSDTYSSFVVILGLIIVKITHLNVLDSILSILLAFYILWSGYRLVKQAILPLLDTANTEIIQNIVDLLSEKRKPYWIDIHNLRVIQYGEHIHIDCHVTFPRYWTVEQSEIKQTELENLIAQHSNFHTDVFIHVDPCMKEHCSFCSVSNCAVRSYDFTYTRKWNAENLTKEENHVNVIS